MSKLPQRAGHRAAMLRAEIEIDRPAFKGGGGNPAAFPQKKRCNLKKRTPPIHTGHFPGRTVTARTAQPGMPSAGQTASCWPVCADILRRRFDFSVKTSPLLFHLPFKVYLKTKKMTNISQAQAGFKAKSRRNPLWISRLFNAKSGCACRNRLNFRLFRYTPEKRISPARPV